MQDYLSDDKTIKAMNEEYYRVLPPHLKALVGQPPFELRHKDSDSSEEFISRGLIALQSFCMRHAEAHEFSNVAHVMKNTAKRIYDVRVSRYGDTVSTTQDNVSPLEAYELACAIYLALPSPENAMILIAISLALR